MDLIQINSMILALDCGALKTTDAVHWADRLILENDEPDERLFDVSTSRNAYEAASHLKSFGEHPNSSEIAKRAFILFADGLENGNTSYERVTRKLYDMAFSGFVPNSEAASPMMCFWDELGDANLGVYGEPKSIKKECLCFLKQHGC